MHNTMFSSCLCDRRCFLVVIIRKWMSSVRFYAAWLMVLWDFVCETECFMELFARQSWRWSFHDISFYNARILTICLSALYPKQQGIWWYVMNTFTHQYYYLRVWSYPHTMITLQTCVTICDEFMEKLVLSCCNTKQNAFLCFYAAVLTLIFYDCIVDIFRFITLSF